MSKRPKPNRARREPAKPATQRGFPLTAAVIVILTLAAVAVWWSRRPSGTAGPSSTQLPTPTSDSQPLFQKLVGKWVRPDGGYVIDIRSADESGKLEASYFNPDPIHVARAEASRQGSMAKVFIELRDVNYPGSTYTLAYDPATDQLKGIYFQAMVQQQFEVFFERLK